MRRIHIRSAIAGTTLALTLTGCGLTESGTTEPARSDDSSDGSPISAGSGAAKQRITPGGVAVIVLEHLGSEAVRQFVTYEPEPGSVSVMVRLRDATPHNFAVQVHSPEQAEMFGEGATCEDDRRSRGESRCRTLANGTTVTTMVAAHGFSDDNADGMVISGNTTTPEDGGALAMYESYDDSPAISVADLEDLLTDPRLTWRTDPAVNEAGEEISVKDITG